MQYNKKALLDHIKLTNYIYFYYLTTQYYYLS